MNRDPLNYSAWIELKYYQQGASVGSGPATMFTRKTNIEHVARHGDIVTFNHSQGKTLTNLRLADETYDSFIVRLK